MNIINQATSYVMTSDKYQLIVTVNITCMMVLASVYLSVSGSLPSTAVIKPIEIWLLFNLAYPFMVIIVNILLQRAKFSQEQKHNKISIKDKQRIKTLESHDNQ